MTVAPSQRVSVPAPLGTGVPRPCPVPSRTHGCCSRLSPTPRTMRPMLGGGQPGGGTVQRLSLACPHHSEGDSQVQPMGSLLLCRHTRQALRRVPAASPPPSLLLQRSLLLRPSSPGPSSPKGCRAARPHRGHPAPLSPASGPATSRQVAPQLPGSPAEQTRPLCAATAAGPQGNPASCSHFGHVRCPNREVPISGLLFLHRTSLSSAEKSPLSRGDGCGEGAQAVARATRPAPAPGSACPAQTCSVRVTPPTVPPPQRWGGACSAPHTQPVHILGVSRVWAHRFPQRRANLGGLLGLGSPPAPLAPQTAGARRGTQPTCPRWFC